MLRRVLSAVLVLCVLWTSAPLQALAFPSPFPDMGNSWFGYQQAVSYLKQKGSIDGYPDGNFHPKDTVNRAEFLKLVFQSRGTAEPAVGRCFSDVEEDAWYAPYVCAAKRRGIVSGYKIGSRFIFKPDQPIVFAEAIKMVLLAYRDDVAGGEGPRWYEPYVRALDRLNILPSWSYIPWAPITRERAADLIARFVRLDAERVVANMSPGCGKSDLNTPSSVTVNGVERSFLLTRPSEYVSHDPAPLLVAFHGRTNSNEMVRSYFGFDRAASEFFIVYPAALAKDNGSFSWSASGDKGVNIRDIAFFDAIVELIGERYCIDMNRIFVAGHSLGAWMANTVACARGGVVRASATVGGDSAFGTCSGPSTAMIIHNPKDNLSPFSGAERVRDTRIKENACTAATAPIDPQSLLCKEYADCSGGNSVIFCPHEQSSDHNGNYYPHVWPREAGSTIVNFFRRLK